MCAMEKPMAYGIEIPHAKPAKPLFDGLFSAVVPCKDEEDMIPLFYAEFVSAFKATGSENFEIIFVEDGSTDTTMREIKKLSAKDGRVRYISFSRNFGKEAAMYAGLKAAKGDFVAIMDADLQDPPDLLPEMFSLISDCDCVAAARVNRAAEPPVRSFCANAFYKALNYFSPFKFRDGARDFRLMRRRVVDEILRLDEYNRFTKGIFEWVGFKTKWIEFENRARPAGKTKWTFAQLMVYSLEAFTSFSTLPLAFAAVLGLGFCAFSALAIVFVSIRQLLFHNSAFGWTSMVCILFFLSGLQLFCLGVLGQYMSKIYLETKRRPHYVVESTNIEDFR